MRRPFILFLILISIYCWLKDLINFLFYFFNIVSVHKNTISTTVSAAGIALLLYASKITIYGDTATQHLKDIFQTHRKKEWLLLLIISLPIILLGLFRSIYPDQNFDTYHFELYLQDYDFTENKVNFSAGSLRTYYFPLSNRMFGLFRHLLGFRLGTLFNTFLLVSIICSIYDFIKQLLSSALPAVKYRNIWPGLMALFVILADNTLFNIGSYKPDIIGIPLMLELIYIIFFEKKPEKNRQHVYFFLIASLTIAYKLTYLPYVGILLLVYYIRHYKHFSPIARFALPILLLLVPSFYILYNQVETGNPIFPFFNKFFHSPLYSNTNFKDDRWGPRNIYETLTYPIVTGLDNSRCNEFSLFSYRLLFGYFISWIAVIYYLPNYTRNKANVLLQSLFYFSLLALVFDYSCLLTTGYYRYGIIVEILYGIVICLWLFYLRGKAAISAFIYILIYFQSFKTFKNIYYNNKNLSWHEYGDLLHNKDILHNNAALWLHDYDQVEDPSCILSRIDGFVCIDPFPMDGVSKILNKNIPIYDIFYSGRTLDSLQQFEKNRVRPMTENKIMVVIANNESLSEGIIPSLNKRGYLATNMYEIYPRFAKYGEPMFLLKIKYLDTAMFTIKYKEQYLRNENPEQTRNDFAYRSKANRLMTFIREAPFAYNWSGLSKNYELNINQIKYATTDGFKNNKIMAIESDSINIHKTKEVPYLIIVQEIEKKP